MDHGRSYNAAVTSSIKANGLLCEHSTSVQCRVMTETWPGRKASGGRAKVILLSNPDCRASFLARCTWLCPAPVITRAERVFSVVSTLFLGLIQRDHTRSQKVGLDTGHLFEFQICHWL